MKQFASVAALSFLFFGVSLWINPETAFGYGYGYGQDSHKEVKKNHSHGKKYQSYQEYRRQYKFSGKEAYTLLKSYKKSGNITDQQKFADMQAVYNTYKNWSSNEIKKAHLDQQTLWKYDLYKKYNGYKKYKSLKIELKK